VDHTNVGLGLVALVAAAGLIDAYSSASRFTRGAPSSVRSSVDSNGALDSRPPETPAPETTTTELGPFVEVRREALQDGPTEFPSHPRALASPSQARPLPTFAWPIHGRCGLTYELVQGVCVQFKHEPLASLMVRFENFRRGELKPTVWEWRNEVELREPPPAVGSASPSELVEPDRLDLTELYDPGALLGVRGPSNPYDPRAPRTLSRRREISRQNQLRDCKSWRARIDNWKRGQVDDSDGWLVDDWEESFRKWCTPTGSHYYSWYTDPLG
jgi:hypothetical protein